MDTAKLMELLRAEKDPNSEKFLSKKSTGCLQRNLTWARTKKEKNLDILNINYGSDIQKYIDTVYSGGRSKYNYIKNGIDFIHHLRTHCKISNRLYHYISDLYSYQQMVINIQYELSKRIVFEELNLDVILNS